MRVLVTGISGYVGGLLADRLATQGVSVRGLSRDPSRMHSAHPVVRGDVSTGEGLDEALEGIDVAYYLVHSMEGSLDFEHQERRSAARFARAAQAAGIDRIVYMGVLTPPSGKPSKHVRSRLAVEEEFAGFDIPLVVLRASIVVGGASRSFRFLLNLVERLPALPLPPWRRFSTTPIDERDLLRQLVRAATAPLTGKVAIWDAAGPDVVTYEELIVAIRDALMIGRPVIPIPISWTDVAAPVAAAIAGEDLGLVAPLMGSLSGDLLPREGADPGVDLGRPRHRLEASIEHALRDLESQR